MRLKPIKDYSSNPLLIWKDIGYSYYEGPLSAPEYNPEKRYIGIPNSRAVHIDPVFHLHELAHLIIATPEQRKLMNYGLSPDGLSNEHVPEEEHYRIEIQAAFLCGRLACALSQGARGGVRFKYLYKTCTPIWIVNTIIDMPVIAMRRREKFIDMDSSIFRPSVLHALVKKGKPFWMCGMRMDERSINATKLAHELLIESNLIPDEVPDDPLKAVNWDVIQNILEVV